MNVAVLLAEDEPVSRLFLVEALTSLGMCCEAVDDGNEAVRRAVFTRFDALMLDLNLPGCDGVALLARVRADASAASRDAPALALTADDDDATRRRLLDAGFAAVATKPIGVARLAETLAVLGLIVSDGTHLVADHAASTTLLWDDAVALAAAGGNRDIVETLRGMLRAELPGQRQRIAAALERNDIDAARGELHRLQASCGFCGAPRLAASSGVLHAALAHGQEYREAAETFLRDTDDTLQI